MTLTDVFTRVAFWKDPKLKMANNQLQPLGAQVQHYTAEPEAIGNGRGSKPNGNVYHGHKKGE